ncbi:MAG: hypothetical protein FJW81_10595 [Actinobacteria bacterium]|nr:hypothetical protein [Actinomycetota bacterium]
MRRAAESRRGQATVEHLVLVAVVATAIALVALVRTGLAERLAGALAGEPAATAPAPADLAAAVAGSAGAPTPLGARAWLAETVGPAAAERALERAVERHLAERHPAWLRDAALGELSIAASAAQHAARIRVRIVDHGEERRFAARVTTPAERLRAGVLAILLDGATTLAHRISRPLGLAASGLRLVAVPKAPDPLPPGTRAGDVIACRPVLVTRHMPLRGQATATAHGWRIVILRAGRVVADALSADDRACRAPTP